MTPRIYCVREIGRNVEVQAINRIATSAFFGANCRVYMHTANINCGCDIAM